MNPPIFFPFRDWQVVFRFLTPLILISIINGGDCAAQNKEAKDVAGIRNELKKDSAWVGEKVEFHIELLSASFFSGTARFELPEIPGAIVMKEKGSPIVSSEPVDEETWSVQRHSFMIYAHRPGPVEIPSFPVRFSVSTGIGKPANVQRLNTKPMRFEAKLPPGAEGISVLISTSKLTATQQWSTTPNPKDSVELQVGDAISRKITLSALEVPGMALPRIPFPEIEGLAGYPKAPAVEDRENRGDLTGYRTESITYVCEQAGRFNLPPMAISWWNTEDQTLQKELLPGIRVLVKEAPATEEPIGNTFSSDPQTNPRTQFLLIVGMILVAAIVYFGWNFLNERVIGKSRQFLSQKLGLAETALISEIKAACLKSDASESYRLILEWMNRNWKETKPFTIAAFFEAEQDHPANEKQTFQTELEQLQKLVTLRSGDWSGVNLAESFTKFANRRHQRKKSWQKKESLPPLNPGSSRNQ